MAWLTQALFGRSPPRGPLHVYGKLGFYQDYLSLRPEGRVCEEFRAWMDQGFAGRSGGRPAPRVGDPVRLLWRPSWSDLALVGLLRDSADRGNLRRFPFAVFTVVKRASLDSDPAGPLMAANGLWLELERLEAEMIRCPSASDFYARFDRQEVQGNPSNSPEESAAHMQRSLQSVRLPDWLGSLFAAGLPGGGGTRAAGIRAVLAALQTTATEARQTSLRLPLSPQVDYMAQTQLWMTMVSSAAGGELPSLVWLTRWDAPGQPVAGLSFRELDPADAAAFSVPEPLASQESANADGPTSSTSSRSRAAVGFQSSSQLRRPAVGVSSSSEALDGPASAGWFDLASAPPDLPMSSRVLVVKLDAAMASPDIPLARLSAFRLG